MTFSITSQIINGQACTILVICTDEPYAPDDVNAIRQTIENENQITYVDWYNAQTVLYKQNLEQDGKYYSWMIVDHKDTTTVVHNNADLTTENKLLKTQVQAQTERSDFLEDCITEITVQGINT
ncbi:MAG: hypothetical protein E7476_14870 [Ruminococcaceae bacterium]|nr:hypothetical protein [Oscillospiraceae bacterium]